MRRALGAAARAWAQRARQPGVLASHRAPVCVFGGVSAAHRPAVRALAHPSRTAACRRAFSGGADKDEAEARAFLQRLRYSPEVADGVIAALRSSGALLPTLYAMAGAWVRDRARPVAECGDCARARIPARCTAGHCAFGVCAGHRHNALARACARARSRVRACSRACVHTPRRRLLRTLQLRHVLLRDSLLVVRRKWGATQGLRRWRSRWSLSSQHTPGQGLCASVSRCELCAEQRAVAISASLTSLDRVPPPFVFPCGVGKHTQAR